MTGEGTGPFKCPRCGATTWGALDYCAECGMYLYREWPDCGKRGRYIYEHTFCQSCGARVEQAKKAAARE